LEERESQEIDLLKIKNYLDSDFVKRIVKSKAMYRETPFVLKLEGQLVQGVIDLYFEEDDGLILVDYKTDRLNGRTVLDFTDKYAPQLEIYEKALVKLTGKKVKEKYIYFIDQNKVQRL
jgi:ATP-dependent helicase/nuclease subunit A